MVKGLNMKYIFEIVGISPVISFFNHQQDVYVHHPQRAFEYVGTNRCTLDAFIHPLELVSPERGWDPEAVIATLVSFWVHNAERVDYWSERLQDAGNQNLLVARVSNMKSIKTVFESLFSKS